MSMDLGEIIGQELKLKDEQKELIRKLIPIHTYPKGASIAALKSETVQGFFVLKGLVRLLRNVDGEERNIQFYTEGDSIAESLEKSSDRSLECLEETSIAVLTSSAEAKLFSAIDGFESLCRGSMEDDFQNLRHQFESLLSESPQERYINLMKTRPDLLQRVPQYHLASYLGIKPESLSRIRRRMSEGGA
ncbi:MAG: Crp/Fnr family transcriptional regulator [Bacteroidetes bacterium]|nr:MAG: Crp/Fnr family transcriptional regulator [Bacteroidota bacterium]